MDEVEFELARVHGLADKTGNKGSIYIKYDLGYSKDEKIGELRRSVPSSSHYWVPNVVCGLL